MREITEKQVNEFREYCVEVEKAVATERLNLIAKKTTVEEVAFEEGSYITLKQVAKLFGIEYSFCLS